MIKLYNTLSRKEEIFKPIKDRLVKIYTCGPTVYWYAHIGNLRTYIFEDILKRALKYNGYKVKHVMNITDVGHLTSQDDTGEDKIELAARNEKKTAWEIAGLYEGAFKKDLKLLNIKSPDVWVRATETIKNQINFINILEKKGFTYIIEDGIYFDSSKLKSYGRLWAKKMKILPGARIEMVPGKKNPTDFALWKFTPTGVKRQMEWDSPWGRGFPGWHTECVVMAKKFLRVPFDIHCGGVDHILIHHTNEIAQAEAVFGKILANYWLHGEFLIVDGKKMAKSKRNIFTLTNLIKKGFNPLSYRYLCLGVHYRSKLNFTREGLRASQNALDNLYQKMLEIKSDNITHFPRPQKMYYRKYQKKFAEFINDDLNTPKSLALMWDLIGDENVSNPEKYKLLLNFDKILSLNLAKIKKSRISQEIKELIKIREDHRKKRNWKLADKVRIKIKDMGYLIEDTEEGPKVKPARK